MADKAKYGEAADEAANEAADDAAEQTRPTAELPEQWSERIARLAATYRLPLQHYFERRVATAAEAEDLTQEVFLRLVRRPEAAAVENLEAYIFRTAANLLRDTARRHRARAHDRHVELTEHTETAEIWSAVPSPEIEAEGKRRLRIVTEGLKGLSPKCRRVFLLHRFDGLPHSTIAALYGISISAVEKHIMRAMVHLRACLNAAEGRRE